jgi:hypothetical protein
MLLVWSNQVEWDGQNVWHAYEDEITQSISPETWREETTWKN